jgi:thiol:disulfide interchange protein DsbD
MRIVLFILLLGLPGLAIPQEFGNGKAGVPLSAGTMDAEFLPVEEAYQLALEVTGDGQVRLYWQIADGYYLYRKRFKFQLEDEAGDVALSAAMNDGVENEDEYFGKTEVYYHYADVLLTPARESTGGELVVTSQGCADAGLCYPPQKQRFTVDFTQATVAAATAPGGQATSAAPGSLGGRSGATAPGGLASLPYMLLLAFLGGCILNLMPCVFPVLSLKVFSFATGSEHEKHLHGWVYSAGVVCSFLLVAAILIGLQQAGAAVGWGFQLQSPVFVGLLAYLFFIMGLGLSGVVEIGASLMGAGSGLADRGGYTGSFFTGVLATVVASPCTAPFMGTALGFAATQPPAVALAVFGALGAGMATPLLLLSHSRTLRERMPRPGPWMETFKQVMAFPLYATAIWLLWVAGRQTGVNGMALLLCGMLTLALGLQLWRQHHNWVRVPATLLVLAALAVTTSPLLQPAPAAAETGDGFSEEALERVLAKRQPAFVNVTADWCITCLANERAALSTEAVQSAFAERGVTYFEADWTNYDPTIADFIARFNRNGIPLYLVYSGRAGEPPQVLPQILTPGIILEALENI